MVLMRNDPTPGFPAQAYRQAQARLRVRGQLICSPAAKQLGCICDILTCGNFQPIDLEGGSNGGAQWRRNVPIELRTFCGALCGTDSIVIS
jgi:hypothetical protein